VLGLLIGFSARLKNIYADVKFKPAGDPGKSRI
jgi:hypothetical protein